MIGTAPFGRTGHLSSRVIFGAAALSRMRQERADEVLPLLLEFGVNHIDTAAGYGESELRLAPWMRQHREDFFLATKTGDRDGASARASLERSLERLGVDHVDHIQLHNLVEPDEWDIALGPGGALEALVQARNEGLTRFIGVTGHGLRIVAMHLRALERFDFDSVLFPYNYVLSRIDSYQAGVEQLIATCAERQVAVQTIKSVARRRWESDDGPHYSWYEPLRDGAAVGRAARWVLEGSGVFLLTSSDARLLRPTLEGATSGEGVPADAEMDADVDGFGISALFDGDALERI
jgi:aryl-alcohol dehydrogenase-like predicted oxidoreductase